MRVLACHAGNWYGTGALNDDEIVTKLHHTEMTWQVHAFFYKEMLFTLPEQVLILGRNQKTQHGSELQNRLLRHNDKIYIYMPLLCIYFWISEQIHIWAACSVKRNVGHFLMPYGTISSGILFLDSRWKVGN